MAYLLGEMFVFLGNRRSGVISVRTTTDSSFQVDIIIAYNEWCQRQNRIYRTTTEVQTSNMDFEIAINVCVLRY